MASIQERLQIKREPLDKWSIREQLCLAVARLNDQNLTSVSRALKPFGEPNRPSDWFHQKNCAAQYGALLAAYETPKRKKRTSGGEIINETPAESIVKKLLQERKAELKKLLAEEKAEYLKLQEDKALLQSGNVSEEQLDIWCKEIDEEEARKEQESIAHAQWLKERELKKQEIERQWRPVKPQVIGQKRKNPEPIETALMEVSEVIEDNTSSQTAQNQEAKPALSPLLTSLLKSPSQLPNISTSSILHSAITQKSTNSTASPTIASLLNSSTTIAVSPGIQQLVSSAIGQEPTQEQNSRSQQQQQQVTSPIVINANDILDDQNINNLKLDDLANSILVQDGPLPEIKNDVDGLISDLIDNAQDIVDDPEQHLQIDGNGDINLNIELEDLEAEEEEAAKLEEAAKAAAEEAAKQTATQISTNTVDPFEFQEEEAFEEKEAKYQQVQQQQQQQQQPAVQSQPQQPKQPEKIEDDTSQKQLPPEEIPKTTSQEIQEQEQQKSENESTPSSSEEINEGITEEKTQELDDIKEDPTSTPETKEETEPVAIVEQEKVEDEIKKETENESIDMPNTETVTTTTTDFVEELYDDLTMEVKIDKTGKTKRDYSRTKKREDKDDKDFDTSFLNSITKRDDGDLTEELSDSYIDKDKNNKIKSENERSSSPWTEEDDNLSVRTKRRLSTPSDSIPNSPASSYYEDDRDYKNWKKSIILLYNRLATNKYASLFLKPITDDQAPGYHSIVYRPMDLSTIRKNIENGTIRTTQEFKRDVMLMFINAIMFNKTNDTVYNMAKQMQQESLQQIQILLEAQTQADTPARRETRTSEPGSKRKRNDDSISASGRGKKKKDD